MIGTDRSQIWRPGGDAGEALPAYFRTPCHAEFEDEIPQKAPATGKTLVPAVAVALGVFALVMKNRATAGLKRRYIVPERHAVNAVTGGFPEDMNGM